MRVLQTKQITNPLQQQVFTLQTNDGILLSKARSGNHQKEGKPCWLYERRSHCLRLY